MAKELVKDIRTLKELQVSDIYTADYHLAMGLISLGYRNVQDKVVIPEKFTEETSPEDIIKIAEYNEKVRKEMARELHNIFRQIFKNYGVEEVNDGQ